MAQTDYEAEKSELNSGNSSKTKWGAKLVNGREEKAAFGVEILALASVMQVVFPESVNSLREAGYYFRHAGGTVSDAIKGGPEGMRSAKNLEEAIQMLDKAASVNQKAAKSLSAYFSSRQEFAANLAKVYQDNETLVRVASRLEIQLKGTLKNLFEVGNSLKPQIMRDIDSVVTEIYGMDPVEAIEKSENLRQFYLQVRKFYDAREQNEATITEFCDYLAQVKTTTTEQNQKIESLFPKLISRLQEGYSIENYAFEIDSKGTDMSKEEVAGTQIRVDNYRTKVEDTRTEVGYAAPLKENSTHNSIDVITNPFVMAAAGVLLWKGTSRILPFGKEIDSVISKILSYPVKLAGDLANDLYEKICMSYAQRKQQSTSGIK